MLVNVKNQFNNILCQKSCGNVVVVPTDFSSSSSSSLWKQSFAGQVDRFWHLYDGAQITEMLQRRQIMAVVARKSELSVSVRKCSVTDCCLTRLVTNCSILYGHRKQNCAIRLTSVRTLESWTHWCIWSNAVTMTLGISASPGQVLNGGPVRAVAEQVPVRARCWMVDRSGLSLNKCQSGLSQTVGDA